MRHIRVKCGWHHCCAYEDVPQTFKTEGNWFCSDDHRQRLIEWAESRGLSTDKLK